MEEIKEFKVRMNTATVIFLIALSLYTLLTLFTQDTVTAITVFVFTVVCFIIFLGMRPHKYSIEKKRVNNSLSFMEEQSCGFNEL